MEHAHAEPAATPGSAAAPAEITPDELGATQAEPEPEQQPAVEVADPEPEPADQPEPSTEVLSQSEPEPEMSSEEGIPPSQLSIANLITGEETVDPITPEMFDVMSAAVDSPDDSWLPCKDAKQMTILKNKDGGIKKWMMINKPEYGAGIPAKYPMMNFKDHEFMKQATDEINDIVVLGQNSAGNEIIHVTLKLPAIKNRETVVSASCVPTHARRPMLYLSIHKLSLTQPTRVPSQHDIPTVRAYREGAVPGRYEVLERSTTHPSVPIMGSSKETGVKRKYIRAYQFAYSRIDVADGDPNSHTSRGIIATNLRGEVPENLVVRFPVA